MQLRWGLFHASFSVPPSLARWAREGLGESVGSYTSTSSSRSKPPELMATIACARTAGLAW